MNKFPITYFRDNLIFNANGDCWAIYKMSNFDYELKKTEQKINMLYNMSRFLSNAGQEVKILIIPTIYDYENQLEKLKKIKKSENIKEISDENIDSTIEYLEEKHRGSVNEYDVYIISNMEQKGDIVTTVKELVSYTIKEPIKAFNDFFGVDIKEIPKRKLKHYSNMVEEYIKRQSERIKIESATENDIEMLIKRAFKRGIDDNIELRTDWKPKYIDEKDSIKPYARDILTLTEGEFMVENRVVSITHENGSISYQTFIAISHMPDNMEFPGNEFFLYLQCLGFPVECCVNIENIDHHDALKKVERKRKEVNAQIEHISTNDEDVPNALLTARESIDVLEDDLKSEKAPLISAAIVICVYSNDLDDLNEKYKSVTDMFTDLNFQVQRPRSDQQRFFMEFFPGTGRYVKDFSLLMPPKTLAGGMFGATTQVGDNQGQYIGYTSNLGKPVFLSLLQACQMNKSASAFVWGALGFGKSFNTNLLVYLHVMNGAMAFLLDPKAERKHWIESIPELAEHISVTTFKGDTNNMGKLDPFLIYEDDVNAGGNLAINIIAELFKLQVSDDRHTVLVEAVQRMKHIPKVPCMETLAEILDNFDKSDELHGKAKSLSRMIKTLDKPGLSGLLYGTRCRKRGLGFKNIINIVEINGLQLPLSSKSKENYSTDEIISTVLMLAVANYAKQFSQMNNSLQKLVILDESWCLSRTEEGKNLFETLARTGRSLNTSTIFIGHSATDVPTEGIRNAITYKFCFNVGNRDEAVESLNFLDMEKSEQNIKLLSSSDGLANAECVFNDAYGRKGVITFEPVFEHLVKAFKTTPESEES